MTQALSHNHTVSLTAAAHTQGLFDAPATDAADGQTYADGSVINGRYTVLSAIGRGGMGWVYHVMDASNPERAVALKVIHRLGEDAARLSWFKSEFRVMAQFAHPNIARAYDFEELKGSDDFLITMERIDGSPLSPSSDWLRVVTQAAQVCRALSYVHSRRIVHFDLKPANILLDAAGTIKVIDFGISGVDGAGHGGRVLGTPQYMAPELLFGNAVADHRADLYALGVTLYELLIGAPPCDKREMFQIVAWLNEGGVRVPRDRGVPEWLAQVVEKLCARDPADRYHTANALLEDINRKGGLAFELETSETRRSYVATPRLSGRAEEQAQILTFIERRLSGAGKEPALMVSGLSGIGKSRLMREVRQLAQLQSLVFIESNCYDGTLGEYGPVADLLYQLVPLVETLGGLDIVQSALPQLVKLAPRLAHGRAYEETPAAATAEAERAQLFETLAEFFVRAAGLSPFALYLNDLQWAGRGPAELLTSLALRMRDDQARGEQVRIALLGSYRSDEVEGRTFERTLRSFARHGLAVDIALVPLGASAVHAVVGSMLGSDDIPAEFLARISDETAGNPFFVQEVMRVLLENGSVYLEQGKWTARGSIGALQIPSSMADVFRRRMDMLDPAERAVMEVLAAHGQPMRVALLSDVCGDAPEVLAALEARSMVTKQRDMRLTYNIAHDRMRETVYADLDEAARRAWHRRIGLALEASADDDDARLHQLAHHFWHAHDEDKALGYAMAAGEQAERASANELAMTHFERVLALGGGDAALRERLADLEGLIGCYGEAMAHYAQLLAGAQEPVTRARLLRKTASLLHQKGEYAAALPPLFEAVRLLGGRVPASKLSTGVALCAALCVHLTHRFFGVPFRPRDARERQRLFELSWSYRLLANVLFYIDALPAIVGAVLSACNAGERADWPELSLVYGDVSVFYTQLTRHRTAIAYGDRALALAERMQSALHVGLACVYRGQAASNAGHFDDALALCERGKALLLKHGNMFALGLGQANICNLLLRNAQPRAALASAESTVQVLMRGDSHAFSKHVLACMGYAYGLLGDGPRSSERFAQALAQAEAIGEHGFRMVVLTQRGHIELVHGDLAGATASLAEARRIAALSRAYLHLVPMTHALYALTRLEATRGAASPTDLREIRRAVRRALALSRRRPAFRAYALLAKAAYLARVGKDASAEKHFQRALLFTAQKGLAMARSDVRFALGRFLVARGAEAEGVSHLRQAAEEYAAAELAPARARVMAVLATLRR